jgi:hypothetical protein
MADQWIVRVQDREYGPVGLDELLEWKREGRLIRENEVRESGTERWFPAGELPELFADEAPPSPPPAAVPQEDITLGRLIAETGRVYGRGFGLFLGLSALVVVPSICAQISGAAMASSGSVDLNLRSALAGVFNLFMFLASLAAWPIYVAGIQILTRELRRGERITLSELVFQASRFWGRTAVLCLLVYGAFFLLIMFGLAILILVAINPPSLIIVCVALLLLVMQIWMFCRFFVATLFWQQTAVLEDAGITNSLSRSNELARSRRERPWWRRPAWQGAVLVSLWFVIALAFINKSEWGMLSEYFRALSTTHDPEAILQSMSAAAKPAGLAIVPFLLGLVQAILRPLLGIGFALLYLDLKR